MKKKLIIISVLLIALSVAAFAVRQDKDIAVQQEEEVAMQPMEEIVANRTTETLAVTPKVTQPALPEFNYEVGSRFRVTMTKSEVDKLTHFEDLIGEEHAQRIVYYKTLSVSVFGDTREDEVEERGTQGAFTPAQLNLLQASEYGTDLLIVANYKEKLDISTKPENGSWTPYISVVPEKEAEYLGGKEALLSYLKENSQYYTLGVDQKVLRSANIKFTISKAGMVENVELGNTSGYKEIDWVMIDLIKALPQNWSPAENAQGETVTQELIFSFGAQGC